MNMRRLIWLCILVMGGPMFAACTPAPHTRSNQLAAVPQPPTPVSMDSSKVLGLWHSNFGAVKIERDSTRGDNGIMGVWIYDRGGEEIIGFFAGELRGNVLEFSWNEPAEPEDLEGSGYISFDPQGARFSGRWWTRDRAREGMWSGWRGDAGAEAPEPVPDASGGNSHGGSWDSTPY